jgi:Flp pilus assembly protein TadG
MALFLPWYIFLFVGAFDWGVYAHSLISIENAARVAALYTSSSSTTASDATAACTYALEELRISSNIGSGTTTCVALPVIVTGTAKTGADGKPASEVVVTYQTPSVIPIPGLLVGRVTINRTVQMRVRS